jgi:tetratricopeptide (TPR) repeat protein
MPRRWLWSGVGLVVALLVIMLAIPLGSQMVTLWAYKAMNVNTGTAPSTDQLSQQIQNMLNLIDFVALIFTAALTLAGVVGFRRFQDIEKDTAARMKELDEKRKVIEDLQKEMQEKINAIGELRAYVELQEDVTKSVKDTNKALLYLILGNQLVEQKKVAEAIHAYEKVKALQPRDPQVNYILGRTYRGISSYDLAISSLEIAVAEDPDFAPAHFELGMAYRNRADKLYQLPQDEFKHEEEYDRAIEQMKLAIKLQPDDWEFLGALAGLYRRAKDYRHALLYYKRVRNVHPDSSYAIGNIAILAWHAGDKQTAREAFERTEELATRRIEAASSYEPYWDYYDRGMARLVLANKDAAIADYRTAINLTRSPEHFKSVLDGFTAFKEVEDKYPIDGLDEVIAMVRAASVEAEARAVAKHVV